jgi:hypothetical protein
MKCYELKDDTKAEGLLISDESGPPRIRVTDTFFFALAHPSVVIYERQPKLAPIRTKYLAFTRDERELTFSMKVDETALLRLDVRGGIGGTVSCSACSFKQTEGERGIEKVYDAFPSAGVHVLAPEEDDPLWVDRYPWTGDVERLEILLMMKRGSSFHVQRTGHLRGLRKNMFVSWDGFELLVTPPKKETLRPPVETGGEQLTM